MAQALQSPGIIGVYANRSGRRVCCFTSPVRRDISAGSRVNETEKQGGAVGKFRPHRKDGGKGAAGRICLLMRLDRIL